jgi:hypothetical protein
VQHSNAVRKQISIKKATYFSILHAKRAGNYAHVSSFKLSHCCALAMHLLLL